MARADGKPFCSCGRKKLSNLSPTLQQTWAASANEKWYKLDSGNLASFRFCKDCHKQRWPSDMRQESPSCKPAAPVWAKWRDVADGVCKLFSGDCFLTRAPPELRRAAGVAGAPAVARHVSCRDFVFVRWCLDVLLIPTDVEDN